MEAEVCADYIHILLEIPPKMSVSSFMGFLKGKSRLIIHERRGNLKYKHGNRFFDVEDTYVDTAGKNAKKIAEYIKKQLEKDKVQNQLLLKNTMTLSMVVSNNFLQVSDRKTTDLAGG